MKLRKTPKKKSKEHIRFRKNPVHEYVVINGEVRPYIPPIRKPIHQGKVDKRSQIS
jgi:hypothetical protein